MPNHRRPRPAAAGGRAPLTALLAVLVAVGVVLLVVSPDPSGDAGAAASAGDRPAATGEWRAVPRAGDPARRSTATTPPRAVPPAAPAPTVPAPAAPATTTPPAGTRPTTGPSRAPGSPPPSGTPRATGTAAPAPAVPQGRGPAGSFKTTGTSAVALTFDDGPDPQHTPRLLTALARHRVKAVFCLVGVQVQRHPDVVRQIAAAGHTLCNHSWDHSLTLGRGPAAGIRADLERTTAAIRAAVPGARVPFFRAPGGNFTPRLVGTAAALRMTSLYWKVDTRDWERPAGETSAAHVQRIVAHLHQHVRPGAVVLAHDYRQPDTVLAFESALPWLTRQFRLGLPKARVR